MKAQIYVKYYGNDKAATYVDTLDYAFFEIVFLRHIHEIKEIVIKPISGSTQETDEVAASTSTSLSETSKNSLS